MGNIHEVLKGKSLRSRSKWTAWPEPSRLAWGQGKSERGISRTNPQLLCHHLSRWGHSQTRNQPSCSWGQQHQGLKCKSIDNPNNRHALLRRGRREQEAHGFRTLGQPLMGGKYVTQKKEEGNIIPKIVPAATPKGSALTSLGPKD